MTSITDVIGHYQRSIEKSANDEVRLLHCIEKLYKLPVTVEHLQQTGIGKTVNSLRKYDKEVGVAAKALVTKWKAMVAAEEKIPEDEDIQRENGNDHDPSSDGNRNNENNGSHNSQNGNYEHHKPKQNHSSRQEDKRNSNVNTKDKKCKENRSESSNSRYAQLQHDSHERKQETCTSSDHTRDKSCNNSNDKNSKEKRYNDKHHLNRRKEEKSTSSNHRSLKNVDLTPEPPEESPSHISDDNLSDDEDEDEEKLIIDTELSKEKADESSNRDSPKSSSKASKHYKSSTKDSKNRDLKSSDHHSQKRSKTSDKNVEDDNKHSTKKASSSSSSHKSEKLDKNETADESRDKSNKKNQDKDSHRRNGEYKSSSSSSKNKHRDSSRDDEKKSSGSKSTSSRSSSKSESKKTSRDNRSNNSDSRKSAKRKHDSEDESSSDEVEAIPKKAKNEIKKINDEGIDSSMGSFSFEEALGLMAPPASKSVPKLKSPKASMNASTSSSTTTAPKRSSSPSSSRSKTPPLLTSKVKLEPLDPKLSFDLPTISPNYKPLPLNQTVMDCVFSNNVVAKPPVPPRRTMTDDEALQSGIQSKTIRTKIYSGVKTGAMMQVPTLFQMCIRVLQKNIDGLEYTGGVPYEVLKAVLEHATPEQLQTFEEFNPYLLEDTDELWKVHCSRRYKAKKRLEMESWREMFVRCKEEQEERLNMLTKNITYQQKQITAPIKRTQLAFVDMDVKPPRSVQRKQEQYGTKFKASATPAARVESLSKMAPTVAKAGDTRLRVAADMRDHAQASIPSRPKKAPLMQKTLQLMKGRFKR